MGTPKLTQEGTQDLEAALLGADLGIQMTQRILAEAKNAFETQGRDKALRGFAGVGVSAASSNFCTDGGSRGVIHRQ